MIRRPEPHEFSARLSDVVELSRRVIDRPTVGSRLAQIAAAAELVDAMRSAMVEGGNPVSAAAPMLLDALAAIEIARETKAANVTPWCMVAAALEQMVRDDAQAALRLIERRAHSTDHDFMGRDNR